MGLFACFYKDYWTNSESVCYLQRMLSDMNLFPSLPVIPNLYLGLSLASRHLLPEQLDSFMRRMLVSRISRRVLAEHHIALSASFANQPVQSSATDKSHHSDNVGIICTNLSVKSSIEHCVGLLKLRPHHVINLDREFIEHGGDPVEGWPEIVIDGHEGTCFSYIKEHLDYIIFELLKNVGGSCCFGLRRLMWL